MQKSSELQPTGLIRTLIKLIVPTALFFAELNLFSQSFGLSGQSVFLMLFVAAVSGFWITKRVKLSFLLTLLFSVASIAFLVVLGDPLIKRLYIFAVTALFAITLYGLKRFFVPRSAETPLDKVNRIDFGFKINQTIVMFIVFFASAGAYGIYTAFDLQAWQMMLLIFLVIFLSVSYIIRLNFIKSRALNLRLDSYKNRTFNFYAFLMGLLMIELAWVLSFLPINHLTFGAILLVIFYTFWNLIRMHLRNELTRNKLLGEMFFLAGATLFILLGSELSL